SRPGGVTLQPLRVELPLPPLVTVDAAGVILALNDIAERLLGPASQVVGRSLESLLPHHPGLRVSLVEVPGAEGRCFVALLQRGLGAPPHDALRTRGSGAWGEADPLEGVDDAVLRRLAT